MASNLERYKDDLDRLIKDGGQVHSALALDAYGDEFEEAVLEKFGGDKKKAKDFIKEIPQFKMAYQPWYSEALTLIKQLLPDRAQDFVRLYEKPKGRKDIGFENYRIEDALQGLRISRLGEVLADPKSAISHLEQQLAIARSIKRRFESTLFEIKQLVQADLFDSEVDAARELLKNKFYRAAGAVAGVVLEKHLGQVCENHRVKIAKKHPTIADFNESLKGADVIDVPQWRFNQHLADIRNLCDHNKTSEPTAEQVKDLIDGVAKVTKILY
ncbi:hypothetical protein [Rhodanobacter ginsengiterrae]|uniref:hypothetical protein n=1 Tax=Rhodanobacter ginsengiterrae TaxID=2008451 RepID=UPI003CF2C725